MIRFLGQFPKRSLQREGHSLLRVLRGECPEWVIRQSHNPLGRAHNYESEACSYSGLYERQALQPASRGYPSSTTGTRPRVSISICKAGLRSVISRIIRCALASGVSSRYCRRDCQSRRIKSAVSIFFLRSASVAFCSNTSETLILR